MQGFVHLKRVPVFVVKRHRTSPISAQPCFKGLNLYCLPVTLKLVNFNMPGIFLGKTITHNVFLRIAVESKIALRVIPS